MVQWGKNVTSSLLFEARAYTQPIWDWSTVRPLAQLGALPSHAPQQAPPALPARAAHRRSPLISSTKATQVVNVGIYTTSDVQNLPPFALYSRRLAMNRSPVLSVQDVGRHEGASTRASEKRRVNVAPILEDRSAKRAWRRSRRARARRHWDGRGRRQWARARRAASQSTARASSRAGCSRRRERESERD